MNKKQETKNKKMTTRHTHKINASGKILGRLATEISILLRGKQKPDFVPYKDMGDFVEIENINKLKVTGKKFDNKIYYRHTGYLGGLKEAPMKKVIEKKGWSEVLRKAVWGMMPKNKLRAEQIKRLKFK